MSTTNPLDIIQAVDKSADLIWSEKYNPLDIHASSQPATLYCFFQFLYTLVLPSEGYIFLHTWSLNLPSDCTHELTTITMISLSSIFFIKGACIPVTLHAGHQQTGMSMVVVASCMNCASHAVLQSGSQFPVYLPASLVWYGMVGSQECCHVDKISCCQLITTQSHASCLITVEYHLPGGPKLYNLVLSSELC